MFATDIAFVFDGGVVEFLGHFHYQLWRGFVCKIKEGVEVEVTIATVSMDGGLHVKFFEEFFDFTKEFAHVFWWDGHVFEEGSGAFAGIEEFREGVTGPSDLE